MPHLAVNRRSFFTAAAAAAAAATLPKLADATPYRVQHSDAQWLRLLGQDRFTILRRNGTEPAFSSPLIGEKRPGTYRCAGCAQALFSSAVKYDSGDGWPSFWTVLPHVTQTRDDFELFGEKRTEVHCARCGGHLGHIFDDGPAPTHLRYCIDGLALRFAPK